MSAKAGLVGTMSPLSSVSGHFSDDGSSIALRLPPEAHRSPSNPFATPPPGIPPRPRFPPPPGPPPGNQFAPPPGVPPGGQPPLHPIPQYAQPPVPLYAMPQYAHYQHPAQQQPPFPYTLIKRETLTGMPPWPPALKLSLITGNWFEWSRRLTNSLAICQLDEYPLGKLPCPSPNVDPASHYAWLGNDRMILNFMRFQMYSSEEQQITACTTSAQAYAILRTRHEKTQIQLIQQLGQIWFDDNPHNYDTQLAHYRNLLYQIESMGKIDVNQLGLLFLLQNLKVSHPTVHDALAPAIMNGSITEEMFDARMHSYFEMRAVMAQGAQFQYGVPPPIPGIALPAFTPRVTICSNCKRGEHTVEFCVAPGGKLAGLSTYEAIMRQRAARDANKGRRDNAPTSSPTTVIINGLGYRLDNNFQNDPTHPAHIAAEDPFTTLDRSATRTVTDSLQTISLSAEDQAEYDE